ncbi:MAG: 4Fe-4S binding protein [Enterocloster bolteae]
MVEINRNACTGCGQCMSDCIANNLFLRKEKQRCPETVSSAATVLLSVL